MEKNLKDKKYKKNNIPGPHTYETRAPYFKTSASLKSLETKFSKSARTTFSVEMARSKKYLPAVGKYNPSEKAAYKPMRKFWTRYLLFQKLTKRLIHFVRDYWGCILADLLDLSCDLIQIQMFLRWERLEIDSLTVRAKFLWETWMQRDSEL